MVVANIICRRLGTLGVPHIAHFCDIDWRWFSLLPLATKQRHAVLGSPAADGGLHDVFRARRGGASQPAARPVAVAAACGGWRFQRDLLALDGNAWGRRY